MQVSVGSRTEPITIERTHVHILTNPHIICDQGALVRVFMEFFGIYYHFIHYS
jgi:hypothetical protein